MRYLIFLVLFIVNTCSFAQPESATEVLNHSELIRILSGLLLVVFIILFLSWIVKRFHMSNLSSSQGFEPIATMILGPKEKIMLIKAGARYLLIGVGTASINTLYDFGDELPPNFNMENRTSFAELLRSAVRKP